MGFSQKYTAPSKSLAHMHTHGSAVAKVFLNQDCNSTAVATVQLPSLSDTHWLGIALHWAQALDNSNAGKPAIVISELTRTILVS